MKKPGIFKKLWSFIVGVFVLLFCFKATIPFLPSDIQRQLAEILDDDTLVSQDGNTSVSQDGNTSVSQDGNTSVSQDGKDEFKLCFQRLTNLGFAVLIYSTDHEDKFPPMADGFGWIHQDGIGWIDQNHNIATFTRDDRSIPFLGKWPGYMKLLEIEEFKLQNFLCPLDQNVSAARSFDDLTVDNLSYYSGLALYENSPGIIAFCPHHKLILQSDGLTIDHVSSDELKEAVKDNPILEGSTVQWDDKFKF
jgi:hypothetical protein